MMYKLEIYFNPETTSTCPIKLYKKQKAGEEWELEAKKFCKGKVTALKTGIDLISNIKEDK